MKARKEDINRNFFNRVFIAAKTSRSVIPCLVLLGLAIPPLFIGLGELPVRVFDEARNIINAIEMSESGRLIVSTYHGEPEMWSSKPPFFTWCMAACIKFFGLSEFSVRLSSALAGLGTVLILFNVALRKTDSIFIAMCSALILLTSEGFAGDHTARTADYDAMLVMWSFLSACMFFIWAREQKSKHLHWGFFFMALAILTKSAAAFLTMPGIMAYLLLQKESRSAIISYKFLRSSLLLIVPVLAFYLGREALNPGYLRAVWENEFGGRYFVPLDAHEHGFWYYAENLLNTRMKLWIWPALLGWFMIPFIRNKEMKQITLYSLLLSASVFLIISTAGTKLFWYDLPLYPWLALSGGIAIYNILLPLKKMNDLHDVKKIKLTIALIALFIIPYKELLGRNLFPAEKADEAKFYELSHYLKKISYDKIKQPYFTIYYTYAEFFYEFYLHLNEPAEFRITKEPDFKEAELVIYHEPASGKTLDSLYEYEVIQKLGDYRQVKIRQIKRTPSTSLRAN
jgi:4-amino-4-deoxy-L-arabinose transferase-like glycosyltransferase